MEIKNALRLLRSEIGLTQSELASAVFVSFSTVNRWENKGMRPNRLQSKLILELAKKHHVTSACLDTLNQCLLASRADDRKDKERIRQANENLKLLQHDLLTAEQFRKTMDQIDIALIGQRFYDKKPKSCDIFYQNNFFLHSLGYSLKEYLEKVQIDPFFAIDPSFKGELLRTFEKLLTGKIDIKDFLLLVKAFRKDGSELWLEIKAASLTEYSYGQEVFTSCKDVTKRIEAEQRYHEEVLLRDVSMQVMFANLHCDLTTDEITRSHNISLMIGKEYEGETFDDVIQLVADAAVDEKTKNKYLSLFNKSALRKAYEKGNIYESMVLYNKFTRRWFRNEYLLVKNPATGRIHGLIYFFDIQNQVLSEGMLRMLMERFFDFVGLIDVETGTLQPYYFKGTIGADNVLKKGDYSSIWDEHLKKYGIEKFPERNVPKLDLSMVQRMLEKGHFYSTTLNLMEKNGKTERKKVSFTYLDDTKDTIIVAQSDLTKLMKYAMQTEKDAKSEGTERKGSAYGKRKDV